MNTNTLVHSHIDTLFLLLGNIFTLRSIYVWYVMLFLVTYSVNCWVLLHNLKPPLLYNFVICL